MTDKETQVKLLKEKVFNSIPEITHETGWRFGEFEIKSAIDRTFIETKKFILSEIDIGKLLKKHNDSVEDYIYDREEKARYVKDFEEFLDKIRERIANFGYGSTSFHTADINLLLNCGEELVRLEQLNLEGKARHSSQP